MPVRRRGNVHNIHVRIGNQVAEIMVGGDFVRHQRLAQFQMILIHITQGHQARPVIIHMPASHPSGADNPFCQLVTGCDKTLAQHVTGNNCKGGQTAHSLQKMSSLHICILFT